MSPESAQQVDRDQRGQEILLAQVRLLCANLSVGVGVTIIAGALLGYLQWKLISHPVVVGWWVYVALVAALRYALARRFYDASPDGRHTVRWAALFAVGAGLAGVG